MSSKKTPTKVVFEKDSNNPSREKKTALATPKGKINSVKDVLPTNNGIYKPVPSAPVKATAKPRSQQKVGNKKPKTQFSSQAKAIKGMQKNVKRAQKKKPLRTFFDL